MVFPIYQLLYLIQWASNLVTSQKEEGSKLKAEVLSRALLPIHQTRIPEWSLEVVCLTKPFGRPKSWVSMTSFPFAHHQKGDFSSL